MLNYYFFSRFVLDILAVRDRGQPSRYMPVDHTRAITHQQLPNEGVCVHIVAHYII